MPGILFHKGSLLDRIPILGWRLTHSILLFNICLLVKANLGRRDFIVGSAKRYYFFSASKTTPIPFLVHMNKRSMPMDAFVTERSACFLPDEKRNC